MSGLEHQKFSVRNLVDVVLDLLDTTERVFKGSGVVHCRSEQPSEEWRGRNTHCDPVFLGKSNEPGKKTAERSPREHGTRFECAKPQLDEAVECAVLPEENVDVLPVGEPV